MPGKSKLSMKKLGFTGPDLNMANSIQVKVEIQLLFSLLALSTVSLNRHGRNQINPKLGLLRHIVHGNVQRAIFGGYCIVVLYIHIR